MYLQALDNYTHKDSSQVLWIMVYALLASTSMWFVGNAIIQDMQADLGLPATALGPITSAVQVGFIIGTLLFAILTIADRFSPSKVLFVSAVVGALANSMLIYTDNDYQSVLMFRFVTGFCLAGIYPVGMKIVADHYPKGLGKALGFLVGALVLGTASPHLIRYVLDGFPWRYVVLSTSVLAALGGLTVLLFVKDGSGTKYSSSPDFSAFFEVFKKADFRAAAFGYFGHMWELYAFWAFIPVILISYSNANGLQLPTSLLSFGIMGIGAISCIAGGYWAQRVGSARVAVVALIVSGLCCLISPFIFQLGVVPFLIVLFVWGFAVIADSPQFSTLVAQTAPSEFVGTALTIVNGIGFAITIITIQLLNYLSHNVEGMYLFLPLTLGPIVGIFSMRRLLKNR